MPKAMGMSRCLARRLAFLPHLLLVVLKLPVFPQDALHELHALIHLQRLPFARFKTQQPEDEVELRRMHPPQRMIDQKLSRPQRQSRAGIDIPKDAARTLGTRHLDGFARLVQFPARLAVKRRII